MSPRTRPLHREPLLIASLLLNFIFGALLLYKWNSAPGGLPSGQPDASMPGMMSGADGLPPGHPDVSGDGADSAPMGQMGAMGGSGGGEMAPEFAAVVAAASGSGAAASSGFALSGTVKVSAKLKAKWPAGSPVFVIARAEAGGPPFAVRRYDGVKAPFSYSLGPDNVMFAGTAAPKRLVVSVRVDQDGDAMTHQLGDLEGGPSAPVGPRGTADVAVDRPAILAP